MGYKDYSSNPDIRLRRMIVLDHFPCNHYCELREKCLSCTNLSTLVTIVNSRRHTILLIRTYVLGESLSMVHQQSVNLDHSPLGECLSTNNLSTWTILHRKDVCPPTICPFWTILCLENVYPSTHSLSI
jgi:hypothetical protein